MHISPKILTVALLIPLTACTVRIPWDIFPTAPSSNVESTATDTTDSIEPAAVGQLKISPTSGEDIDRPSYPEPNTQIAGFAAPPGNDIAAYLAQPVDWEECSEGMQCAQILAPLDYADPGKQAITLAMQKRPATAKPTTGVLFINPGGPGASGKEAVETFPTNGLKQFDILGWDPRGVGDSTPIKCQDGQQMDELFSLDASPDDEKERSQLMQATADFGKSCWDRNGSYLSHISTQDTVRDLDFMRELLGQKKLYYFGYSYGTMIGALYAEMFGDNAARVVLDSAMNITEDKSVIQAMGFDTAFNNFAKWAAQDDNSLGETPANVVKKITTWLDELDAKPLEVSDQDDIDSENTSPQNRYLTQTLAALGIGSVLYSGRRNWKDLADYITAAMNGDGATLLWFADQLNDRKDDGEYGSMAYALPAIDCLDESDKGLRDADKTWTIDEKKAPIFGKYLGLAYTCPLWPVKSVTPIKIHGKKAESVLVVGTTGDNATPYQHAVDMAKRLEHATLLTLDGEGHGAFGKASACVNNTVITYLTKGALPVAGKRCT